jgi:hypothetical protein
MRHIWIIESKRKETKAPWKIARAYPPFLNKKDADRGLKRIYRVYNSTEYRIIKYVPEGE